MSKVKYIVFNDDRLEDIVIFSELQTHSEIAHGLPGEVVSAGFIRIFSDGEIDVRVECYGESISLEVESRPEQDTKIARRALNLQSMY